MNQIEFFTTDSCPFCLNMEFVVILKNLGLPIGKEIETIYDNLGDPRVQKLRETFGSLVPLPTLMADGEIRQVVSGVYDNLNDNFKLIDSLLEE